MAPPHIALILVITLIWGFNFVAGKAGVNEIPPILFTGLRFLLLSVMLVPFLRIHRGQMWPIFVISMTMGGVHFALFYGGLAAAEDVSTVAIAVQLGVPFSTIMSILFLNEKVYWRRWSGIALSFLGVMVIGFDPKVFTYIEGLLLVVAAAFVGSIAMIFMRRLEDVPVFQLQAWIALLSWPLLFLFSAIMEQDQLDAIKSASWLGWSGVLYTAIGASLIGHAGMYYLLQRYEVTQTAPLTLLAPIWGVVFSVLLLGDTLTERMLIGGVMTLIGVGIVSLRQKVLVDTGP
ncbi:MAG TPA: EamA family transporter [Alphaproteobacteria bacterium]|nr:EamA family transporter [Alphaproteobacteria bacterium]HBA43550.1 EamA family transporter [Alphaproteobacteria bacterium]HBC54948.1 EamA family transporter [Alphaproteobacteria bacterium]